MESYDREAEALRRVKNQVAHLASLLAGRHKGLISPREQAECNQALALVASIADRREIMFENMETLQAIRQGEHFGPEGCTESQLAEAMGRHPSTLTKPLWELWEAGIIHGSDMDRDGCRPETNEISIGDNFAWDLAGD